jgi:hypothetical protein
LPVEITHAVAHSEASIRLKLEGLLPEGPPKPKA